MAEESKGAAAYNEPSMIDQQGAIEATGCASLNEQLLLCYDMHRDWRRCKPEMEAFRDCYRRFQRTQVQLNNTSHL